MFLGLGNSIWTGRNRINHLFLVLYLFLCLIKCLSFILNQAWSCLLDKTTVDCGNSSHFAFIFYFYTLKVVIWNFHISHKLKCPGGYLCVSMCQQKKGSGFLRCCCFFLRRTSRIVTINLSRVYIFSCPVSDLETSQKTWQCALTRGRFVFPSLLVSSCWKLSAKTSKNLFVIAVASCLLGSCWIVWEYFPTTLQAGVKLWKERSKQEMFSFKAKTT